jgi:hypothetical protein
MRAYDVYPDVPFASPKDAQCQLCVLDQWKQVCFTNPADGSGGPCDAGPLVRCEKTGDCPELARAFDGCLQAAMADPESACGRAARACWSATPSCFDDGGDSTGLAR